MIREDTFIFKVNIIRNQLKIILNMISYYKKNYSLKTSIMFSAKLY